MEQLAKVRLFWLKTGLFEAKKGENQRFAVTN
jgi:hypothetical protein